jgi:hypothetical protein
MIDAIRIRLDPINKGHFEESVGILFSSQPFELPKPMEYWFLALAPSTVGKIADNFDSLSFDQRMRFQW